MAKRAFACLLLAGLLISGTAASPEASRPIRQTELLALVAGNALPENIVNEIRSRGIAFRMNDTFRTQLKVAGAAPAVLAALSAAKAPARDTAIDASNPVLVQQITTAAQLMKEKHYQEAADQLTATLKGNFEKFEIGFIMGEILRQQENWGQAAAVYGEVLRQDPNFPEAHTKLSFVLYYSGDGEDALREAKTALARTPENPEAYKNAGLALHLLGKLDAALAEYKEALRIKPDYGVVHYDMALVFDSKAEIDGAIAEYKRAIALAPDFAEAHNNLGISFGKKGDFDSAIREGREAKRLDPGSYNSRQNLASALINAHMYPEAISELREMESIFPGVEMCHLCLGRALQNTGDAKGAEKEFRIAAKLEPGDPEVHISLGLLLEDARDYDGALAEYRAAEELDENFFIAHRRIGAVLLKRKDVPGAVKELKSAVDLDPSEAYTHDLYAQALLLSGDVEAAISEFKESLGLDTNQVNVMLELAAALEKKGDWVASLDQYRQAAAVDNTNATPNQSRVGKLLYDAPKKYSEAQERFQTYIVSLRKAGKSTEAEKLESAVRDAQTATNASQKLDLAMQSGSQAFQERRFDDAERSYNEAALIAETLPQPEVRLATALGHLGQLSMYKKDFAGAQAAFAHQLKVTEQVYGPQSPATTDPLKWMAFNATAQQDLVTAQKFFDRALDVNRKAYGENSTGYSEVLRAIAGVYMYQKVYEKAEAYLVQAASIEEKLYGQNAGNYGPMAYINLDTLCMLYDRWGKSDKLESCDERLIVAIEKQYGPDSPFLEDSLASEAKTLRTLGRAEEAARVEQRLKSLQPSAANNPN
jgi:tetratricopeptide (TPR) repeat protein